MYCYAFIYLIGFVLAYIAFRFVLWASLSTTMMGLVAFFAYRIFQVTRNTQHTTVHYTLALQLSPLRHSCSHRFLVLTQTHTLCVLAQRRKHRKYSASWPDVHSKYITTRDGVQLHYQVMGTGPKVMFIANGLGGAVYFWEPGAVDGERSNLASLSVTQPPCVPLPLQW